MERLVGLKDSFSEIFQETHNVKFTFFHLYLKALASALMKFPKINSGRFLTLVIDFSKH